MSGKTMLAGLFLVVCAAVLVAVLFATVPAVKDTIGAVQQIDTRAIGQGLQKAIEFLPK